MEKRFELIFDEIILAQLKKLGENKQLRDIISKMLDKMEELGPRAGKLIDSHLFLYEIKAKQPPIRLYYKHVKETNELYVFEYEMKTSEKKQQKTIQKLKEKSEKLKNQDLNE
jgi:mRNA-degrading endonuclease RelE of RelBE toxin-antitoxin system